MAQHDYNIANAGGAAVRADINAALLAILSKNSGPAAPTVTAPFMWWFDTTNNVLLQRNANDTAWVRPDDLERMAQPRVDVASAATVNLTTGAAATDHINITGTTGITAFTIPAGRMVFVRFAGSLTLTNNVSIVTQTGSNIVTQAGDTCILRATAANVVEVLSYSALSKISNSTAVALTNQTAVDFTGIPAWANRVTIMLAGVSTNGTSALLARLGTSGGVEATGYLGGSTQGTTTTVSSTNETTGVALTQGAVPTVVINGAITLQKVSGNTWVASGVVSRSDVPASSLIGSSKTLAGVLDRVRITTANGTDQYDAGTVNISWE